MKILISFHTLLFFILMMAGCSSHQEQANQQKPSKIEVAAFTSEAVVEAIDQQSRKVTLKGPLGNSFTITAGQEVRNLAQVEVGDKVKLEIVEALDIKVLPANEAEPDSARGVYTDRAKLGDKPGAVVVGTVVVISTIEKIDLKKNLVTLKDAKGKSHTIGVREPENLKRVVVGDQVVITYTEAVAILVTK